MEEQEMSREPWEPSIMEAKGVTEGTGSIPRSRNPACPGGLLGFCRSLLSFPQTSPQEKDPQPALTNGGEMEVSAPSN